MEPVLFSVLVTSITPISILRLRMEPVISRIILSIQNSYFYPQAPHGACRFVKYILLTLVKISILRLRMEPVYCGRWLKIKAVHISILRLRMEPVRFRLSTSPCGIVFLSSGSAWSLSLVAYIYLYASYDFYPQAPHGACPGKSPSYSVPSNFYPQAPHGACPFASKRLS